MQPDENFDPNKAAKQDLKKLKRVWNFRASTGVGYLVESAFWAGAVCGLLGMVAILPWVGPDGVVAGQTWLFGSLAVIVGCALVAVGTRLVRTRLDEPNERRRVSGADLRGR